MTLKQDALCQLNSQIGGKRGFFPNSDGLAAMLASGPHDNTSASGYYTAGEYRTILQYATERHIEVIPEFDMPGHSHAAIQSMAYRHSKLMDEGRSQEAAKYQLVEEDDKSVYWSVQHIRNNALNPCLDSTYTFVEQVRYVCCSSFYSSS